MEQSNPSMMWVICEKGAASAKEVKGYPSGRAYIVQREFPPDVVQRCKKASWNLLYASDGMDAEFPADSCVVTEAGELKGHLVDGVVLWYADFSKGGKHETAYRRVSGRLVRLGFSRW